MADPIDQLGLDVKPFKRAVQEANQANSSLEQSTDRVNASISRAEKTASGARFWSAAAVAGVLYKLGDAITSLGDRTKDAIEKFQAGGSRLDANASSGAGLSVGLGPIIQDAAANFKNNLVEGGLDMAKGMSEGISSISAGIQKRIEDANKGGGITGGIVAGMLGPVGDMLKSLSEGADNFTKGLEAIKAEGDKEIEKRKEVAALEDEAADQLRHQSADREHQLAILNQQLKVQEKMLEIANLDTVQGRQQANQAKAQIGAINLQMDAINFQREQSGRNARAETAELQLQQDGMKNIGAMVKLEAEYTSKIAQARREGNTELATNLALQLQLKQNQLKVAEHNLTPRELANERKAARKFDRDLQHQGARDKDMADRIARGVHGATPGSRLDRFRRQQAARAGAVPQNMTVNEMQVSTMKVNIP